MKKLLIIFLVLTYISFSYKTKKEANPILIGPTFGLNYNSINTNKDTLSVESGLGYNIGLHYTYILGHSYNSRSSISIFAEFVNRNNEINDIQKNVKYDLTNNYFIFKTYYDFDIAQFSRNIITLQCGPYFSYLLNSNITTESEIEFPENEFQNFEMGLGFGLNYTRNFGKYNLSIGYNFMLGLTDAFEERDFRYESHNINLIYTFII